MKRALFTLSVLFATCGAMAPVAACTKEQGQQVTNLIQPAAACVVDVVTAATGGPVDIADIIKQCGVTVEDVIAIVSQLLESKPDSGADAALGLSPDRELHLRQALQAAYAFKAAHK